MITALLTSVFVLAVNLATLAIYRWYVTRPVIVVPRDEDAIDRAILQGMTECGVRLDPIADERDLGHKWPEVLWHAGTVLGYERKTIADLREWLR